MMIEYHHTPLPTWLGGIRIKEVCPKCHILHEAKQRKAILAVFDGKCTSISDSEIEGLRDEIIVELKRLYGSKPFHEILFEHATFKDPFGDIW